MYWNVAKIGGKFEIWSKWLKKVMRNLGGWKSKIFWGKGENGKFSTVWKFLWNRGDIWNRGEMHHCLRGNGRPWIIHYHTFFWYLNHPHQWAVPLSGIASPWFFDHLPEPLSLLLFSNIPSTTQICVIRQHWGWEHFWVVPLEEALYKCL